jgi:putative nucleotidyltransferase with HDIG domain
MAITLRRAPGEDQGELPDPREERLLEESRERASRRLGRPELLAHLVVGLAFLLAATALAVAGGGGESMPWGLALVLTACLVVFERVEFDVGAGYTVPTQVVFVPMLFLLPLAWVPLLVAAGLLLGRLPAILARHTPPQRALLALGGAWFALGPALVFVLADVTGPSWGDWPIYLAALAAQFAFDLGASVAREWIGLGVPPELQLRVMGLVYVVDALLAPIGLLAAFAAEAQGRYAFLLTVPLVGLFAVFARERRGRVQQAITLSSAYRRTALLLGDVVGDDDAYTGTHSQGVVSLAVAVAERMRVDERQRRLVEFGALLHDIGKIRMPKEIVNKPGPLTDDEWAVMRRHTIVGQEMLAQVGGLLAEVGIVVRASHERWDGNGYPDGLVGPRIPLPARIIACSDAFNAITTERPYRPARDVEEALEELRSHAGRQFDPEVVEHTARVVQDVDWPRRDAPERRARPRVAGALPAQSSGVRT